MIQKTTACVALWLEARTRFTNQLKDMNEADLVKKISQSPNSAGFLIRHMAEVELLFAKNVFGAGDVKITAKTVIAKADTGEWVNLNELLEINEYAFRSLKNVLENQSENDWEQTIITNEFGTKTKAEALGRIVSHTAYHAGQLALVLKYGNQ